MDALTAENSCHTIDDGMQDYHGKDNITLIIKTIEDKTGIKVVNLQYDTAWHEYDLCVPTNYNGISKRFEVTGLRAAKIALSMYYKLTHIPLFFSFELSDQATKVFGYYCQENLSDKHKSRKTAFGCHRERFIPDVSSAIFSEALLESIKKNTGDSFTVTDHFKKAFDVMFCDMVWEYGAQEKRRWRMQSA